MSDFLVIALGLMFFAMIAASEIRKAIQYVADTWFDVQKMRIDREVGADGGPEKKGIS